MSIISYYIFFLLLFLIIVFVAFKFGLLKFRNSASLEASGNTKISKKIAMTYEEALEASKQFIYDIIKLVMQKFSQDDIKTLLDLGRVLASKDVKYMHVVDVQALQYQKFVQSKQQTSKGIGRS
jgi:hypothetical protein